MASPENPEFSKLSIQELENMHRRSTVPEEKKAIAAELTRRYSQQYLKQETTTPSPSSPIQPASDNQSSSGSSPQPQPQWQPPPQPQAKPQPKPQPQPQPQAKPQPQPQRVATAPVSQSTTSKSPSGGCGGKVLLTLFVLAAIVGAVIYYVHKQNNQNNYLPNPASSTTSVQISSTCVTPYGSCNLGTIYAVGSACSCVDSNGNEVSGTVQ